MQKSLDTKLNDIRTNPDSKEFIICYAADPDMGGGISPWVDTHSSLQAYYDELAALVQQAKLDILLSSVSTMDVLARDLRLFDESPVTPSIRANDTTDIWNIRGSSYVKDAPSNPLPPPPSKKPNLAR